MDFDNKSYVLDIVTFIIQYLNIFLLDLKLETELEKNMLMFVWEKCLPVKLTNFVSNKDNYDTLTKNNLKFKDVYSIIHEYVTSSDNNDDSGDNYNEIRQMLKSNFDEIRYVFSTLFSKIYSRTNEDGKQIKVKFDYNFSLWFNDIYSNNFKKQPVQQQQLTINRGIGKNMNDYKNRTFINEFEQKPLKNDLIDVIEVLEEQQHDKDIIKNNDSSEKSNLIEVKKEEEINSFVKKIKPMNDVKNRFLNEREQRKHAKLMKKKKDLEEQLKKNTEQWNLLKPVFKTNERQHKQKLIRK